MQLYKYETHLHSSEGSACAVSGACEQLRAYKAAGYAGVIFTDHFFNGNTAIDRSLPWKERVDAFCRGYENALAASAACGMQVFFGLEYNFAGDEYLLYGIDRQWLYENERMMRMTHRELFEAVDAAGGLMVQAHPFRRRSYIRSVNLHPHDVHAVEAYNAGNTPEENAEAYRYALQHKLPMTSGSDMHNAAILLASEAERSAAGYCAGGMAFAERLGSVHDFVERVKGGGAYMLLGMQK